MMYLDLRKKKKKEFLTFSFFRTYSTQFWLRKPLEMVFMVLILCPYLFLTCKPRKGKLGVVLAHAEK